MKLYIKPLSVNKVWKGRRFKTDDYKTYEQTCLWLLSDYYNVPKDKITLYIKVGLSSKLADLDNVAKPFIDILQKRYKFNDNKIYRLIMEKEIVKKGEEYIEFKMEKYETDTD